MNGHGAPTHNIAINEACDFVSETFRVTMLHLTGLFKGDAAIQWRGEKINARYFSTADVASFGMDVHAGVGETSGDARRHIVLNRVRFQVASQPSRPISGGTAHHSNGSGLAGLSVRSRGSRRRSTAAPSRTGGWRGSRISSCAP